MYIPSIVQQRNSTPAIAFYNWLGQTNDPFADFDADESSESQLAGLLGKSIPQIHYLGHHGSGSLICLWEKTGTGDKIVWLDSEGSPNAVFANDFAEFLSLLPYDTKFIYKVISKTLQFPNTTIESVKQWFTQTPEQIIEANKSRYPGLNKYLEFLKEQSIIVNPAPIETIFNNCKNNADFSDWITKQ